MQQQTEKPVALRACPFCESDSIARHPNDLARDGGAIDLSGIGGFYAHCDGCGAEGPQCDDELASIHAWNRRATDERVEKMVEAAEKLVLHIEERDSKLVTYYKTQNLRTALAAMKEK